MEKRKKERKKVKSLSCVRLFATPWTVASQAPLSMGFSKQEYWSRLQPLLHWQVGSLPLALPGNQLHVYTYPLPLETSIHPSPLSH